MLTAFIQTIVTRRIWVILLTLLLTALSLFYAARLRIVIDPAAILPQSHPFVASKSLLENVFGEHYTLMEAIESKSGNPAEASTAAQPGTKQYKRPPQPFALVSHRIQRYGSDAAWAFGTYTLRTELAYTRTGKTGDEFSGKKYDYRQAVVGLEKQFANNLNVILQAVWQSAFDFGFRLAQPLILVRP